jgi:copper chaperone CopZ
MAQESLSVALRNVGSRHDEQAIKDGLDRLRGVKSVSINRKGTVVVDYDSTGVTGQEILDQLKKMGFSEAF